MAAARQASLAELAEAVGTSIADVRLGLRRLAEQLEPAGMQILDDGSHVQLAPAKRFHEAVAQLVQPERLHRLTQEQAVNSRAKQGVSEIEALALDAHHL